MDAAARGCPVADARLRHLVGDGRGLPRCAGAVDDPQRDARSRSSCRCRRTATRSWCTPTARRCTTGGWSAIWGFQCQRGFARHSSAIRRATSRGDRALLALARLRLRPRPQRRVPKIVAFACPAPVGAVPAAAERSTCRRSRAATRTPARSGSACTTCSRRCRSPGRSCCAVVEVPLLPLGAQVRQRHVHRRVHIRHGAFPRARRTGAVRARGDRPGAARCARVARWTMPPDVPVDEIPVEADGVRARRCRCVAAGRQERGTRQLATGIGIVGLAVAIPLRRGCS